MTVPRKQVLTSLAPLPPSFLSQAIIAGDVVYCSGQIGVDPETGKLVNGTVGDRTVCRSRSSRMHLILIFAPSDKFFAI